MFDGLKRFFRRRKKNKKDKDTKDAKAPNPPPKDVPPILYLVLPYANPVQYQTRRDLLLQTYNHLKQVQERLEASDRPERLEVVVSQVVYDGHERVRFPKPKQESGEGKGTSGATEYYSPSQFDVVVKTSSKNAVWSKENLINLVIKRILRKTGNRAVYFAFVDADITFTSSTFVSDTVNILSKNHFAFVQMFEKAVLLGPPPNPHAQTHTVEGFAHQYWKKGAKGYVSVNNTDPEYWHPGFAWAIHRDAFKAVDGLIDRTLGSADRHMAMALIIKARNSYPHNISKQYKAMVLAWERRAVKANMHLSHIPGVIHHSWHGSLANRRYVERWDILVKHGFEPKHLKPNKKGFLEWAEDVPEALIDDVVEYFNMRNEDDTVEVDFPMAKKSKGNEKSKEKGKEKKLPKIPKRKKKDDGDDEGVASSGGPDADLACGPDVAGDDGASPPSSSSSSSSSSSDSSHSSRGGGHGSISSRSSISSLSTIYSGEPPAYDPSQEVLMLGVFLEAEMAVGGGGGGYSSDNRGHDHSVGGFDHFSGSGGYHHDHGSGLGGGFSGYMGAP
ncbi:hypothetical protein HK102_001247 [Quaeritorhiza haematococci]|nr:hypothetical protein HK102_001247 [Quaeritorhiza haematococci]